MSALHLPEITTADAHRAFEASLPRIDACLRYHFRSWPSGRRHEAIDDARSVAWVAWDGLVRRGKDPVAVGVTAIATNAARVLRKARAVAASRAGGRGGVDVHHPRATGPTGLRVVSFEELSGSAPGDWQACLASDRRYGPADEAAFRIDFSAWLAVLPPRKRRAAELLAAGEGTGEVARQLGVTPGAVSQAREWLSRSWKTFQGEGDAAPDR
jgi:hypothetical protein